jgi:C-terminal processing protease CtpA/Prc
VYVLTSSKTFSGGEGLAYILQEHRRAEIIGEITAGAANPGRTYRLNALFEVTVPNGKVVTSVRRSNWEGTGVTPDVIVPAGDALRVAHVRALRQSLTQTPAGPWRDTLERELRTVEAQR